MTPTPPRFADRLLRFFCDPYLLEEVQGDLHEEFAYQVQRVGERRARWRYWRDVLGFIRPLAGRSRTGRSQTGGSSFMKRRQRNDPSTFFLNAAMIRNYVAIALRQLWKNQLFSLINITGLTVGLAVSMFIALYVWHEFHYDRFEPFADRTYQIVSVAKYGDQEVTFSGLHESFGRAIQQQIPEAEAVVRFSAGLGEVVLQSDQNHRFKESAIGFADQSMLSVMGLRLLHGDAKTALSEPSRMVLTRQLAEKYFGAQNPVGKTLIFDKQYPFTVSGVLDDLPTNSVIQFNGLVSLNSMPALGARHQDTYQRTGFLTTYLVLRQGAKVSQVEKKLDKVKVGVNFVDASAKIFLEPLPTLHLGGHGDGARNERQSLYILLTVALVILVLAVINYVSLTTARATKRAREVGVRKAIGGQRSELISQFFVESFLTTTLAFLLSLILLQVLFPWANQALDLHMDKRVLTQGPYWGVMIGLWLSCSLLSGSYPALLLSGFRPALVLKGNVSSRQSGASVRRVFTTVQFTASIGLLICSVVLYTQMQFLRTKSLGIDRAQVVGLRIDGDMVPQFSGLRDKIRQWAGSENVAVTNTQLFTNNIMTYFLQAEKTKKQLMVNSMTVDKPFFAMMGIRWQYPPMGWEAGPVTKELNIYNQTLIKEAGIADDPRQQAAPFKNEPTDGVVNDFHVRSLHGPVSPMRLTVVSDTNRTMLADGGYILVRLNPQTNVPQALDHLKELYNAHQPTSPFDYYFLDEAYNKLYASETRLMQLFNGFTGLTLLVACLGLLGLMTFTVEVRTKEIGVRKVLGASVAGIVMLLSHDFLKLIGIALVIASPIAWWAMNSWLQDFAYKIDIEWWVFALAGGLTTGIALVTVSMQSLKAALTNPVKSLRSE
ncbi:permease prefix domain 2-containing transporter [Spirosoma oryzicola]|uniref:permease prefix domain 2-containing transporter n=1 Tax=Spirosoma oryzicola TaxID=2898794 RepID=UPI001E3697FE|nr:permease prefix domain 2-containing transporter [Spirosoma oryzicola]UHG92158.1 permease prefix domain 2-containing transporter [Spirosoma oryzicola]